MTALILASIESELVPIVAIIFSMMVPILAMYFYYQNRNKIMDERKLMIEKGLTPPPLSDPKEFKDSSNSLIKGINLIAIAIGLLGGFIISSYTSIQFPFSMAGSILFFLGLGKIFIALMKPTNDQAKTTLNSSDNEKL